MNRLLLRPTHHERVSRTRLGDNLKPKRSGAESDETPSFAANAAVSFRPQWLQDTKVFPDASVDLVYLDPPFNSNAN